MVTLDHDTLKSRLEAGGVATTVDSLDLPAGVVSRLACDADLIPAVLGSRGEVLDVGRNRRLVTPAIWTPWSSGTGTAPSPAAPGHP